MHQHWLAARLSWGTHATLLDRQGTHANNISSLQRAAYARLTLAHRSQKIPADHRSQLPQCPAQHLLPNLHAQCSRRPCTMLQGQPRWTQKRLTPAMCTSDPGWQTACHSHLTRVPLICQGGAQCRLRAAQQASGHTEGKCGPTPARPHGKNCTPWQAATGPKNAPSEGCNSPASMPAVDEGPMEALRQRATTKLSSAARPQNRHWLLDWSRPPEQALPRPGVPPPGHPGPPGQITELAATPAPRLVPTTHPVGPRNLRALRQALDGKLEMDGRNWVQTTATCFMQVWIKR